MSLSLVGYETEATQPPNASSGFLEDASHATKSQNALTKTRNGEERGRMSGNK